MCEDNDLSSFDSALAARGLTRREFVALSSAALVACNSRTQASANDSAQGLEVSERVVSIDAGDGAQADGFFVHPARGAHPGILLWPDIAGLRETFRAMARRLAGQGYAVLVVNPYYRGAKAPVLETFAEWLKPEGKAKVEPLRAALTPAAIRSDAEHLTRWLLAQEAVDKNRKLGTMGFCMGGPFAVWTAAAVPKVGAAASLHGGGLVREGDDSPHRMLAQSQAGYLFAIGKNDDATEPTVKDALRQAANAAQRPAEIEVYPADHGWTVPDSPVYDKAAAERAWQRWLALFGQHLT